MNEKRDLIELAILALCVGLAAILVAVSIAIVSSGIAP